MGSGVQGGPVNEFLGVAVECPALDQLEVEVGPAPEDRVHSGLAGDHGGGAGLGRRRRDTSAAQRYSVHSGRTQSGQQEPR